MDQTRISDFIHGYCLDRIKYVRKMELKLILHDEVLVKLILHDEVLDRQKIYLMTATPPKASSSGASVSGSSFDSASVGQTPTSLVQPGEA